MKYLLQQPTLKRAPQSEPIPGREKDMIRNAAGGFTFKADSFARMQRFLILGSEGGTYYIGERDLTKQNVDNVRACLQQDGPRAVKLIEDISVAGRAPKNDPALYALALAASCGEPKTRDAALAVLPNVARIGTHLFTFCAFVDSMRGWGPALRKAVADWYEFGQDGKQRAAEQIAYQCVKYQQRNGWSHRDILRLAHPVPHAVTKDVFRWVMKEEYGDDTPKLLMAFGAAKTADERELVSLIRNEGLTREMIPTEHQKSPAVWEALLEKMPMGAMIRTLGRMGAVGLLRPISDASRTVVSRLGDRALLRRARVHPIQVLAALLTYQQGHGQKGKLTWTAVPQIVDALNDAFYATFDNVEPTGKRFYLGVDVSGSMTSGEVAGMDGLTPNMGAAAMAMLIARTEPNYFIGGFSTCFVDLGISRSDRLDAAMRKCQRNFGGTDCAVAIKHAQANGVPVDAFVIISDGETWAGEQHVCQALNEYRRKNDLDSKLIVINMVANRTSLCDPTDLGSVDVVGFDTSVPTLISEFLGANARPAPTEDAE